VSGTGSIQHLLTACSGWSNLMEAWFLADRDALADYYANGFLLNTIGDTADVEQVPKAEVMTRLKRATKNT
jgi:hypothetical protein